MTPTIVCSVPLSLCVFPMICGSPLKRPRSEEHTSELQSHLNLVCRLLLEKKKLHGARRYIVTYQPDPSQSHSHPPSDDIYDLYSVRNHPRNHKNHAHRTRDPRHATCNRAH